MTLLSKEMNNQSKAPGREPEACGSSGPFVSTGWNNGCLLENFRTPGKWDLKNLAEVRKTEQPQLPGACRKDRKHLGVRKVTYVLNIGVVTPLRTSVKIHRAAHL